MLQFYGPNACKDLEGSRVHRSAYASQPKELPDLVFSQKLIIREHRKYFVESTKEYEHELKLINRSLGNDNKNYHTWAYRLWLCKKCGLHDQEKEAVELLIS